VSSVGDTLRADQIHHNMFQDKSELDYQTFSRFAFPEQDDILVTLKVAEERVGGLKNIAKDLQSIRSFLSCLPACDEPLTQAVFKVFLTNLLEGIINDDEANEKYSAQLVSGMKTLKVDALVSQEYMNKNFKKRNLNYHGGAKEVVLTIVSDLVVWKGGLPVGNKAEQQQRMFLDCNVNVAIQKVRGYERCEKQDPIDSSCCGIARPEKDFGKE
jgi:hypothetical protein